MWIELIWDRIYRRLRKKWLIQWEYMLKMHHVTPLLSIQVEVDETNALNVSDQLKNLTSDGTILVPDDIETSVDIIGGIVNNLDNITTDVSF